MRIVNLPPDTKGVGTPESEIKDPNGRIMGYFDNIDKLRMRLARWLHINGRLDDFMGQPMLTKAEAIAFLSPMYDNLAEGIDDVPEWHHDDRYYGLNFAQPEYLRNFYRAQASESDDCPF